MKLMLKLKTKKKKNRTMLKTCKYCGIVPENHVCPHKKPRTTYLRNGEAGDFRKTYKWTKKSEEIRERDKYLCQVCIRNLYNTTNIINYRKLEVHHIVPINEDYDKRLDDENLITLCSKHHKMADAGEIPREELLGMTSPQGKEADGSVPT